MHKLAIITTHPIQYNAPLFQLLAERGVIQLKVFYTWSQAEKGSVYDPGFGMERSWDIPLLTGYNYTFVENASSDPGSHHYSGIKNPGLISLVTEYQPNAVLIYGWNFHSHLQAMRFFKGKYTVLFRGDSTLLDEDNGFSFKKMMRRAILKWVYRHIDYAVYAGENNKKYFLAHNVPPGKLVHAPHCIDNSRFSDNDLSYHKEAAAWKKTLGLSDEHFIFLCAGKLEHKKGVDVLIKAFKKLKKPGARLVIAGDGELKHILIRLAEGDTRILFLPFQNQGRMPVLYRLADVFVLPSRGPGETWGLAINEAMACERAVIVSNKCGGANDLVSDSNGRIFPSEDIDALAVAMDVILDKETALQMGRRSAEVIRAFSFEKLSESIESIVCKNK